MQDMMARRAPKLHGDLSHQERALVNQQVELYLDGKLEKLQIVSVKQIEVRPHTDPRHYTSATPTPRRHHRATNTRITALAEPWALLNNLRIADAFL